MARRAALTLLRAALLAAALLSARGQGEATADAASAPAAAAAPQPQPLLARGTVLHSPWAPEGARVLEADSLVYLRCYPTTTTAAYSHPDSMLSALDAIPPGGAAGGITPAMVAAAASASRGAGLHATLPVERVVSADDDDVASNADVATPQPPPPPAGNAYAVGDWAALNGADLWCELYDIDRAAAGLADALGGALLRAADFAAAGTDQLSVTFVSVVGGSARRAATVAFRCPLCAFGDASHASLAAAWLQGASTLPAPSTLPPFAAAANAARADALAHAGGAAYSHATANAFATLAADSGVTDALSADVAELIEAIAHAAAAAAHHADGGVDRDAPHHAADGTAAGWLDAMMASASDHAANAVSGAVAAASMPAAPPAADDALGAMEAEAVAAVREAALAARRRNGDVSIFVYAMAGLTTRLAMDADVPIIVSRAKAEPPLHVREAVAAAREERWGDGAVIRPEARAWAVAAATLAAVACGAAVAAGLAVAWRRRGAAAAQGPAAAHRKLKRKNSDFRQADVADAAGMCQVPLGTPRDTPRGAATPRSARREAGANAA